MRRASPELRIAGLRSDCGLTGGQFCARRHDLQKTVSVQGVSAWIQMSR